MRRGASGASRSRASDAPVDVRARRRSGPIRGSTRRAHRPQPRWSCRSSRCCRRARTPRRAGRSVSPTSETNPAALGRSACSSSTAASVVGVRCGCFLLPLARQASRSLLASPATADAPPPGAPSDAAIAQYVEAVPSVTWARAGGRAAEGVDDAPTCRARQGRADSRRRCPPVDRHHRGLPVRRAPRGPCRSQLDETGNPGASRYCARRPTTTCRTPDHRAGAACSGGIDGRFRRIPARRPLACRDYCRGHRRYRPRR